MCIGSAAPPEWCRFSYTHSFFLRAQPGDRISALQAHNRINLPPSPGFDCFHHNPPTFKSDFQLPKAPTREYVINDNKADNKADMRLLADGFNQVWLGE